MAFWCVYIIYLLICRYGDIYKSHVLGCPCVMVSSPEAVRVILVTKAHMFKPTYPPGKERMIGRNAIFFHQGAYHSRLRRLLQASFVPSALKGSVPEIEQVVLNFLPTWKNCTINTLQEMKMVDLYMHRRAFDWSIHHSSPNILIFFFDFNLGTNTMRNLKFLLCLCPLIVFCFFFLPLF